MPRIEVTTIIPKKNKGAVYALLKKMNDFPSFMRSVKKLSIIEKTNDGFITSWKVEIDGATISWKEVDIFDDTKMSLNFRMIEGDYHAYAGEWCLEETAGCTRITLTADFDWGVPAFEKFVGDILKKKAYKSLRSMLNAIKRQLA